MNIKKNILSYAFIEVINKAIPFLLLPIFVRLFSPAEYSLITNYYNLATLFSVFVGFATNAALSRYFFKKRVFKLVIKMSGMLYLISSALIFFGFIIVYFSMVNIKVEYALAAIYSVSYFPFSVYLLICRLKNNVLSFAKASISELLVNITLTAIFVIHLGAIGRITAVTISSVIFGAICFWFIFREYNGVFKGRVSLKKKFSLESVLIVPHVLTIWVRNGSDKFFVSMIYGSAALGLYGVATQSAMVISVISNAINLSIGPYLMKSLNDKINKEHLVRITYYLILSLFIVTLGYVFLLMACFDYVVSEDYFKSKEIAIYITVGLSVQASAAFFMPYILYSGKTKLLSQIVMPISIFLIFLQFFYMTNFEFKYVGIFYVFQSLVYVFTTFSVANKCIKMPWFKIWKVK
ncbi:lipopolysaccharide biosynthesis protein [Vibrio harveyi]